MPVLLAAAVPTGGLGALAWVAIKVGALSYGGGFVIIPFMQTDAVNHYHWMTNGQFLNAVALGQITPGPVVQTIAVVGYAAAGLGGGLLASLIAFSPSFVFVLLGGNRFQQLRDNHTARSFLNGAGPAAIGAILGAAIPLARQYAFLAAALLSLLETTTHLDGPASPSVTTTAGYLCAERVVAAGLDGRQLPWGGCPRKPSRNATQADSRGCAPPPRAPLTASADPPVLECEHLTQLELALARHEVERPTGVNPQADLVKRKGDEHEAAYLDVAGDPRVITHFHSPATARLRAAEHGQRLPVRGDSGRALSSALPL